jgi:phage shock protein E
MKVLVFSVVLLFATVGVENFAQDKITKPTAETKDSKVLHVEAEEFDAKRKADTNNTVVLDVRTKGEYRAGHIPRSVVIDFTADDFEQQIAKLDKDKTYLVHCASGGRSARACKKMEQLGFKKLYNLEGGMAAWEKAGKPIEK